METTRTLRLGPAAVMTGDLLIEVDAVTRQPVESVITNVAPAGRQQWSIETVRSTSRYASQRRVTVKRSGPRGLGE